MNFLFNLCCVASFACMAALAVGGLDLASSSRDGSSPAVKRVVHSGPAHLGSHARAKVAQYFATYQNEPLGLPPGYASRMNSGDMALPGFVPGNFVPGKLVPSEDRDLLIEIPAELLNVLPVDQTTVRYYLAGNQLVAVDAAYRILDTIPIPTVRTVGTTAFQQSQDSCLSRHER